MTVSEPPGEQSPEDDTALLTAALSHYWAAYDGQTSRIYQVINFYIVASAILFTGYTTAINGNHYGVAAALAIAGLGLTALTGATSLGQARDAAQTEPGLIYLRNCMASRLGINPIAVVTFQPGITRRRVAGAATFGLAGLLQTGGLLYALIH
jgi:hypothetical protein